MTPRPKAKYPKSTVVTLRVSDDMFQDLRTVQERDGVPISEQIRRGIAMWLESKGVRVKKSERQRAGARKRA